MRKANSVIAVALLAVLALASTVTVSAGDSFRAHLSGKDSGAETLAQGQAIFKFSSDGSELHYRVNVANIDDIIMSHIHLYVSEAGGPPVVWLFPDQGSPAVPSLGSVNGTPVEGTADASRLVGPLTGKALADLRAHMEAGYTYVDVHPTAYPGGDIRDDVH